MVVTNSLDKMMYVGTAGWLQNFRRRHSRRKSVGKGILDAMSVRCALVRCRERGVVPLPELSRADAGSRNNEDPFIVIHREQMHHVKNEQDWLRMVQVLTVQHV